MATAEHLTTAHVLVAFEGIRRAQRAGVYAPHKPLLILLALARVQAGAPRLTEFCAIEGRLLETSFPATLHADPVRAAPQAVRPGRVHRRAGRAPGGVQPARDCR